jgi:tetratricopeptide (TPR) repeat protein
MKRRFFILKEALFIACILIFSLPLSFRAFSEEESAVKAEPYLCEGDMRMFNGEPEEAQKIYEFILKEDPHSYGALWRLSHFYISRGMAAKKIIDKKKEWRKAKDYGRCAVQINPNGAEGHLYSAIAIGKLALLSSLAEKVKSAWEIKKEAEKAIELDPNQQKAYLALGAWHRNVATASPLEKKFAKILFGELPKGSLEESLQFLLKSISLGGTEVTNYYELALTYEALGDYEAAKREYKNALYAKPVYPEDAELKERAKEMLCKSQYN